MTFSTSEEADRAPASVRVLPPEPLAAPPLSFCRIVPAKLPHSATDPRNVLEANAPAHDRANDPTLATVRRHVPESDPVAEIDQASGLESVIGLANDPALGIVPGLVIGLGNAPAPGIVRESVTVPATGLASVIDQATDRASAIDPVALAIGPSAIVPTASKTGNSGVTTASTDATKSETKSADTDPATTSGTATLVGHAGG